MRKLFSVLIAALLFYGCPTSRKISNLNLSHLYKNNLILVHPKFTVHHETADSSRLYFGIDSEELLYTRQGIDQEFTANIGIHYRLMPSYESKDILDSGSVVITDVSPGNEKKQIIGSIMFRVSEGATYLLLATVEDKRRGQKITFYIPVDKSSSYTAQNFLTLSPATGAPLFRNYLAGNEEVRITSRIKADKLFVRYYNRSFPVAPPPHSVMAVKKFEYKADSVFTVELKDQGATLTLPREGFYHFQLDSSKREGETLFRFALPFPEIGSAAQLIRPLIYITTDEEYEELIKSTDPKASADEFWLKMTGSRERAKELIRKYYTRVQEANALFTSYLEGWKTDRGMIYIVYGPPGVVFRTNTTEVWIYGQDRMMTQNSFTFARVQNPFTDNDYSMERTPVYKSSFQNAVSVWRQGRVFMDN